MRAPEFWRRDGVAARALAPLSLAWRAGGSLRRRAASPPPLPIPTLCVGNVTVGGAGKTPTALALLRRLAERGVAVHAVTRGYGGSAAGPLRVAPQRHTAEEVGDEALLLARAAPTWVARDRPAGVAAAAAEGATLALLDDGLQNPHLAPTLSLLVVDGGYGLGNRRLMPAGPLRESLAEAARRVAGSVLIGEDATGLAGELPQPVLRADLVARAAAPEGLLLPFAGIGRPEKFFSSLREAGGRTVGELCFPDHSRYTSAMLTRLEEAATARKARLVTTEKDAVRLPQDFRDKVAVFAVELAWRDPAALDAVLAPLLAEVRR